MTDTRKYYAQVTEGIVTDVHVVTQLFMDENPERYEGTWIETFIDAPNKTYAGVGYTYDPITNDFIPPPAPPEPVK